jgi:hypothetical protein
VYFTSNWDVLCSNPFERWDRSALCRRMFGSSPAKSRLGERYTLMVDQGPLDPEAYSVVVTQMGRNQGRTDTVEEGAEHMAAVSHH